MQQTRKTPAELDDRALDAVQGGTAGAIVAAEPDPLAKATPKEFTVTKKTD